MGVDFLVSPVDGRLFNIAHIGFADAYRVLQKHENDVGGQAEVIVHHEKRRGISVVDESAENHLGFLHEHGDFSALRDPLCHEGVIRFLRPCGEDGGGLCGWFRQLCGGRDGSRCDRGLCACGCRDRCGSAFLRGGLSRREKFSAAAPDNQAAFLPIKHGVGHVGF